jgi:integrase/recombinase XerC
MSKPLAIIEHDRIQLPYLFHTDEQTAERVLEFFAVTIRNPHTRKAYMRAATDSRPGATPEAWNTLATCSPSMWPPGSRSCSNTRSREF